MDNLTDKEMTALNEVKTEEEWNSVCSHIKRARNGHYPTDWYEKMIASGNVARILSRVKGSAEIRLVRR